jgi:hypothetical protein
VTILHFTNGDSTTDRMRSAGLDGELIPWRDILHEGPVPAGLSLDELSEVRAEWLASEGLGSSDEISRDFAERDDFLRRFCDFDEVVLWFEWDLYDQLQLIQILDFMATTSAADRAETGTRLSIVSLAGYLGNLEPDAFIPLFEGRRVLSDEMLELGKDAWTAFRSPDPRQFEAIARRNSLSLEFLAPAIWRELEEFPSSLNGLSRSESQILEAIAQGPLNFHEIFKRVAQREERIFCGDATLARYIERMSRTRNPLIVYSSGEQIDAPRTEDDSRAFRNAEMALTVAGRDVLACDRDWIDLGGSDRWLGGVHLEGAAAEWRWDPDRRSVGRTAEESFA